MRNGNVDVGNKTATRKPAQLQMTGAMSQQDAHVMGDTQCAQQKLVRLVGCRDPRAKAGLESKEPQFGQTKR